MKYLALPAVLLLAVGCVPVATVPLSNPSASEAFVQVQDLRPAEEALTESFSLYVGNPAYGISRYGDDRMVPSELHLLKHRCYEKLQKAGRPGPVSLKVHHFVVYNNSASLGRSVAAGATAGVTGVYAPSSFVTQREFTDAFQVPQGQEYLRAYYKAQENPHNLLSFVVYLDAELDGKRVFIRHFHPYRQGNESNKAYQVAAV